MPTFCGSRNNFAARFTSDQTAWRVLCFSGFFGLGKTQVSPQLSNKSDSNAAGSPTNRLFPVFCSVTHKCGLRSQGRSFNTSPILNPVCKMTRITRRFDGIKAAKTCSTSLFSRYSVFKKRPSPRKNKPVEYRHRPPNRPPRAGAGVRLTVWKLSNTVIFKLQEAEFQYRRKRRILSKVRRSVRHTVERLTPLAAAISLCFIPARYIVKYSFCVVVSSSAITRLTLAD